MLVWDEKPVPLGLLLKIPSLRSAPLDVLVD
jgi:hypothetical protein